MSLDIALYSDPECRNQIASFNITHNLNKMATEACIYEPLWRPEEVWPDARAADLEPLLREAIPEIIRNRWEYAKFDAPNGWGTVDDFIRFIREVHSACVAYPTSYIRAYR